MLLPKSVPKQRIHTSSYTSPLAPEAKKSRSKRARALTPSPPGSASERSPDRARGAGGGAARTLYLRRATMDIGIAVVALLAMAGLGCLAAWALGRARSFAPAQIGRARVGKERRTRRPACDNSAR